MVFLYTMRRKTYITSFIPVLQDDTRLQTPPDLGRQDLRRRLRPYLDSLPLPFVVDIDSPFAGLAFPYLDAHPGLLCGYSRTPLMDTLETPLKEESNDYPPMIAVHIAKFDKQRIPLDRTMHKISIDPSQFLLNLGKCYL